MSKSYMESYTDEEHEAAWGTDDTEDLDLEFEEE